MENFWTQLTKPIFVLAPMEDVTDVVFREIFARHGKPDVMFTEFVNIDGLLHPIGQQKLLLDLKYTEMQRPMVAQLWGSDPEKFKRAAELVKSLGYDGIDINMGCPQDKEIKLKTCAALIRDPELAVEIIVATKEGAGNLPVSVKTRIGYTVPEINTWIKKIINTQPAVLTIHGRTKQEKSKVPARWDEIKKAVELRNTINSQTLIIGNGDIQTREQGLARILETGVDGVMVARGAFGNPWLFRKENFIPTPKEVCKVMLEHIEEYEKQFTGIKSFMPMRKNMRSYCSHLLNGADLRMKLINASSPAEAREAIFEYMRISPIS